MRRVCALYGEVHAGGGTGSIAAANRAISRSYGRWQSLLLWVCYFATFTFYVAAEIGLANWLPPFATLFGLASEADAALLTTAFYATFTCTRLLAAFTISRRFSSVAILSACFVGSVGSIGLIWLAVSTISDSKWLLWIATGLTGFFFGPIWPAWVSIPKQDYGVELRALDMGFVLSASKAGMALEQVRAPSV